MQLDFQQLIRKLETVTELRPIPDKEYVETYVKGYYVPESGIDQWISEHKVRGHTGLTVHTMSWKGTKKGHTGDRGIVTL